ncbi:MAG TPA: hypothetical protein VGK59_05095 [Ohtaekwangia sp.]
MKISRRLLQIILRSIYLSVLPVFFVAIFNLIKWHQENTIPPTAVAAYQHTADNGSADFHLTAYSFRSVSGTSTNSLLSFDPVHFESPFLKLITICSVSFLFAYIGLPLYNLLAFHRPLKVINRQLEQGKIARTHAPLMPPVMSDLNDQTCAILKSHNMAGHIIDGIQKGNYAVGTPSTLTRDKLGSSLLELQARLKTISEGEQHLSQIHTNAQQLERILKDESDWKTLTTKTISFLSKTVEAGVGVMYEWKSTGSENFFSRLGSYGYFDDRQQEKMVSEDHGQLGEMARERKTILLENLPANYLVIHSAWALLRLHTSCYRPCCSRENYTEP